MLPVFAPHTHTSAASLLSLSRSLSSVTHTRTHTRALRPGRGSASARRVSPHRIAALPPQPPSHSRSPSFLARPYEWMPVTPDTVPSTLGGSLGVAFTTRNTSSLACFFSCSCSRLDATAKGPHYHHPPLSLTHTLLASVVSSLS